MRGLSEPIQSRWRICRVYGELCRALILEMQAQAWKHSNLGFRSAHCHELNVDGIINWTLDCYTDLYCTHYAKAQNCFLTIFMPNYVDSKPLFVAEHFSFLHFHHTTACANHCWWWCTIDEAVVVVLPVVVVMVVDWWCNWCCFCMQMKADNCIKDDKRELINQSG